MKNIYSIFEEIGNEASVNKRREILKANADNETLQQILQGAFHPAIKFLIPNGIPAFKSEQPPEEMAYVKMPDIMKRIYVWVEGNTKVDPNLTQKRRDELLAEALSAMEEKEADVFVNMLLKDFSKYKYLTKNLVEDVFPGLTG